MRAVLSIFVILAWISTTVASHAQTLLRDSFDNDAAGSFPNGWNLVYNGGGTNLQVVDTSEHFSKPNSLKLVGSSCWSANAYHPTAIPSPQPGIPQHVRFSAEILVGQVGAGGCSAETAGISFYNPSVGSFGTTYSGVTFESDGFIYAALLKLMPYKLNVWYNVLVDSDLTAQTSDIYINGALVSSGVAFSAAGLPTGVEVWAGHGSSPTAWFDNILVTVEPSIADWTFDEGAGSGFIDTVSAATANNGTLINGLSRSSLVHAGTGYSLLFNGPKKVAVVGDSPSLRPARITLEAWINPAPGALVIVGKQFGATCCGNSYQIRLNPFQFQITDQVGEQHFTGPAASPTANAWHHVAGTFDGRNMKLYLDKKLVATGALDGKIGYDSNPVVIGGGNNGKGVPSCCAFSGLIDEVRISYKALGPANFLP